MSVGHEVISLVHGPVLYQQNSERRECVCRVGIDVPRVLANYTYPSRPKQPSLVPGHPSVHVCVLSLYLGTTNQKIVNTALKVLYLLYKRPSYLVLAVDAKYTHPLRLLHLLSVWVPGYLTYPSMTKTPVFCTRLPDVEYSRGYTLLHTIY